MVYCGKPSQGCAHCRARRIKCDKKRPDCSQCIRASKECPGYRDPLSLLFRDESGKVMAKAHARWATADQTGAPPSTPGPSSQPDQRAELGRKPWSSETSSRAVSVGPSRGAVSTTATLLQPVPPPSSRSSSSSPSSSTAVCGRPILRPEHDSPMFTRILSNLDDQGVHFYVTRYLLGQADEPELATSSALDRWLGNPALHDVISAVGLAGLANLAGAPREMADLSRQKYGKALKQTAILIRQSSAATMWTATRSVVLLAMFEVVNRGSSDQSGVNAHIMGAAALMRSWLPLANSPPQAFRGLLQLCYSTFIPAHAHGRPLPASFFELLSFCRKAPDPTDAPSTDLAATISAFIHLSGFMQRHVLTDGSRTTRDTIQQLLSVEDRMAVWEAALHGKWLFRVEAAPHLDSRAVFEGHYHVYHDLWTARVWNYYRWARILLCQLVLDSAHAYPETSGPLISAALQTGCRNAILRLARDTLESTPSHWWHPMLTEKKIGLENIGPGGSGSTGLPALLFQIRTASCAAGVAGGYWQWAFDVMQCIWAEMGMHQARSIMDMMVRHRESVRVLAPAPPDGEAEHVQVGRAIRTSVEC